jgi:hypothetical protein
MTDDELVAEHPRFRKQLAREAESLCFIDLPDLPDAEGEYEQLADEILANILTDPQTYKERTPGEVYTYAKTLLGWRINRFKQTWIRELSFRGPSLDAGWKGEGEIREKEVVLGRLWEPIPSGPTKEESSDGLGAHDYVEIDVAKIDFNSALSKMRKQQWFERRDRDIAIGRVMESLGWHEIEDTYGIPHTSAHRRWTDHIQPFLREALADYHEEWPTLTEQPQDCA